MQFVPQMLDADNSGVLEPEEVRNLLAVVDVDPSRVDDILQVMDADGKGHVSLEDVKKALESQSYYLLQVLPPV